jgi:hypothetical protein
MNFNKIESELMSRIANTESVIFTSNRAVIKKKGIYFDKIIYYIV